VGELDDRRIEILINKILQLADFLTDGNATKGLVGENSHHHSIFISIWMDNYGTAPNHFLHVIDAHSPREVQLPAHLARTLYAALL
jgi:hypothetical protein